MRDLVYAIYVCESRKRMHAAIFHRVTAQSMRDVFGSDKVLVSEIDPELKIEFRVIFD